MAKSKTIAHGVVEFSASGLAQLTRDVKRTAQEIEKVSINMPKGGIVDREKAAMVLALIKETTKGYAEMAAEFAAGKPDLFMTKQMIKELNDPAPAKVLSTYKSMSASLVANRRELEAIGRLQKNLPVGEGLSYGHLRGVAGRAEGIKERDITRQENAGAGELSLKAMISEVVQVLGRGKGAGAEVARASVDTFEKNQRHRASELEYQQYGSRHAKNALMLESGAIDQDQHNYRTRRDLNQGKVSGSAQRSIEAAGDRHMGTMIPVDQLSTELRQKIDSLIPPGTADPLNARLRMLSTAAQEVANSINVQARSIGEMRIDQAMADALKELNDGKITKSQYAKTVDNLGREREAARSVEEFGRNLENPNAPSKAALLADAKIEKVSEIRARATAEGTLTEEMEKRLDAAEANAKQDRRNAEEVETLSAKNKELSTRLGELAEKKKTNAGLSRAESREMKRTASEIQENQTKMRALSGETNEFSSSLHDASRNSRRFNYMMQQASYGVQDFYQVIGQTGLSGALRASANNIASLFGAMGTVGGAAAGAGVTILMIGIADAIQSMGGEAETTAKKLERLANILDRIASQRDRMTETRGGLASDESIAVSGPGYSSSLAGESNALKGKEENAFEGAAKDWAGGFWTRMTDLAVGIPSVLSAAGGDKSRTGLGEMFERQQVRQVAADRIRGTDGIVAGKHKERLANKSPADYSEADKAMMQVLEADIQSAEGLRKILSFAGVKSEEVDSAVSAMADFELKLRNMVILGAESVDKMRENVDKFMSESITSVEYGDYSAIDEVSAGIKEMTSEIARLESQLSQGNLSASVEGALLAGLDQAGEKLAMLQNAKSDLSARAGSRALDSDLGKSISGSTTGILQRLVSGNINSDMAGTLAKESLEGVSSGMRGKSGREFGLSKEDTIKKIIADTNDLLRTIRSKGPEADPIADQVKAAATEMIRSMRSVRDEFEEMTHSTQTFIRDLADKDTITASFEEAFSGAAELASKSRDLNRDADKIQSQQQFLRPGSDEFNENKLQIENLRKNAGMYSAAASQKLASGMNMSPGADGFVSGAAGTIEQVMSQAKSIQSQTGMTNGQMEHMARENIKQSLFEQLDSWSGQVSKRPGESESDAEERVAGMLDKFASNAPAFVQDIVREFGVGAIGKMQGTGETAANYNTSVGSSEGLWSSIQQSISGVSKEKETLDETKKIAAQTEPLQELYKTPLPVALTIGN